MKHRVVITGLGAVSPLGNTLEDTWQAILRGENGVGPITLFDASTFPVRFAAEVKGFSPVPYIAKRETRRVLGRAAGFGLGAAKMAWEDAQLTGKVAGERVGVVLGGCLVGPSLTDSNTWCLADDNRTAPEEVAEDPFGFVRSATPTGAALIASELGARGPNLCVYVACASSAQAMGTALRTLRRGEAEVILTGGYDSMINEWHILLFAAINALSTRNKEPQCASRPFDKQRDGFVMGEGAAVLVLEERDHALRRGAPIYAEMVGYGDSLDAYRITDSPPSGEGAALAINRALEDADLQCAGGASGRPEIDYINAHGTSTKDNDISETRAIKGVFGSQAYKIPISSTKSMTGHLISAAGALEAAITVLALRDGLLPPTINLENPDPECDLDYVPLQPRARRLQAAMSNSFGFGGSNGSVVFRRAEGASARPAKNGENA